MNGYAAVVIFDAEELALLKRATRLVDCLPDYTVSYRMPVRCHELARAVGQILKLKVIDGRYGVADHSWLMTEKPYHLLDVYACGRLPQVQLVDVSAVCNTEYRFGEERQDINTNMVYDLLGWMERGEARR